MPGRIVRSQEPKDDHTRRGCWMARHCKSPWAARLYSLIGTCRLNGIDPHHYLRHVLERIATHPINRVEELLPWQLASRRPQARAA